MDINWIKKLINLVEKSDIASLAIENEGDKIEIKKDLNHSAPTQVIQAPLSTPMPVQSRLSAMASEQTVSTSPPPTPTDDSLINVTSPMVGTYYSASGPDADPFVTVGQTVSVGDQLCIIEAMKLFNDIESEFDGTIEEILVANNSPIEYGQVLFKIRKR